MTVVDLLTLAKKINNYDIDATAGGLWTTDKIYKVICPAGKRWFLYGGAILRDVSTVVNMYLKDAADSIILHLGYASASTGVAGYPTPSIYAGVVLPVVVDAGEYIEIVCVTSQAGAAYATCMVLEVDV